MKMKLHVKDIVGKMTLSSAIRQFGEDYPGTVFYIGSSSGSGFYFIGTADEFERDIEDINKTFEETIYSRYIDLNEDLLDLMRRTLSKKDFEKQTDMLVNEHEKFVRQKENAYKYAYAYKNWIPMQDRIVSSISRKDPLTDDVKNGVIIKIKGIEEGRYWFYNEYITKKVVYESSAC